MTHEKNKFQVASTHGIDINISNMAQALEEVEDLISCGGGNYVCFFEANLFYRSLKEPEVKSVINQASLIYPDGISSAKCASLFAQKNVERVSGPSFILEACRYGLDKKWRHFFLGGADGVAQKLADKLQTLYPELEVAGCYCPPFRPLDSQEEVEVKNMIEDNKTDLLWVGLGGPKQEFWMNKYQDKINVPVMLGVGAAFDFHSNNRPWAPKIIRKMGLEWLYRAISGGRQTLVRNIKCVSKIATVLLLDRVKNILGLLKPQAIKTKPPQMNQDICSKCDGMPCNQSMPYCPFANLNHSSTP